MVRIRTVDELILNAIDFYKSSIPELDTKPGTVARDLLIDGPSEQLGRVYDELARVRAAQSLRLSLGSDLDKLANNFGAVRKQGSVASGTALYTFNEIEADIPISIGDTVVANNGSSFKVTQGTTVSPVNINQYRATASKYRSELDFAGITDEYAVEVLVEATSTGVAGNISRYALNSSSTDGVSNVTNTSSFSGGTAAESDQAFRNRVLSIFSGANTGTALGYRNAVLADPQVLDAIVIEPGDPLMTRDGTVVYTAEDGTQTIVSEGTGGKVDIYVNGVRFQEILDSYIYRDNSNKNDPTDPSNDFVLGQIEGDEDKTVSRKRIENLEDGDLPDQPVNNIVEVSGSTSGPNFSQKQTDSLGRVTGNYELIRDDGAFGGSPWGFDRIHWIDDTIRDFTEEQTKGRFNGKDPLTYPDVTKIGASTQNISVVNENSTVSSSDRSSIQLAHQPVTAVTRVYNLTTGERYVVSSQNPDGSGSINETGRITISGNTLPATSDILQVDYTWIFDFDDAIDFDNRLTSSNPRTVVDSVDWGFSNAVSRERSIVESTGSISTVTVTHPITTVIEVNTFAEELSTVQLISGRLGVVVSQTVQNVESVERTDDQAEVFNTNKNDGSFSGLTIFLPTDTIAEIGDSVNVVYNTQDTFTVNGVTGSFDSNSISLPSNSTVIAGTIVEVSYIADVKTLLPQTLLSSLPAVRNENGFTTTTSSYIGTQPTTNIFSGSEIIQNLRKAPSRLQMTISGQISAGTLTVSGTSFTKVAEAVFTVSNSGLTHDLSSVIKSELGIPSSGSIPSNVSITRVTSVDRVQATDSFEVLSVDNSYDMKGYQINDDSFDKENSVKNESLSNTQFTIPSTVDNIDNTPSIGDSLRVTFYIGTASDTENVSFSKSGTLSTQKRFALVDSIGISSGFSSATSQTSTLTVNNLNQPSAGGRYSVSYDYTGPKSNERITIRYNKNSVIESGTLAVEDVRPISADVLVKSGIPIVIDVEFAIVVTEAFENSTTIVQQNVIDVLTSSLNSTEFGNIIDESDLISDCYQVDGVDRVRSIAFNREDEAGRVLSIESNKNEYTQAGTVTINIETR